MATYNREEVYKKTLEYFNGDELAANVFINKYALKDSDGNIYESSPDDMHKRIASEIARIESKYPNPLSEDEIYDVIKDFKYIVPQGGPMTGIGNTHQVVSLSNCFVIGSDNEDSYGSICKTDEEQVQLMKRRGGVGHDLSHLRPSKTPVKNSAITSSGVVSFMERYSNSTREVGQDGRRGALMLSMHVKNMDAQAFMDAKMEQGKVTGANISLKLDDEFMNSVINDTEYTQQYPINSKTPSQTNVIKAKKLFDKLIHNAWKSAEPGVLFWDTVIRESVPDCYADQGFRTTSTNPCGEVGLAVGDSCRLIVLYLYSYVENPFTKNAKFNFDLFKRHTFITQRIMDDIIDLELEKIDQILEKIDSDPESERTKLTERELWLKIKDMCIRGRRTGIGITAEGDMLAAMGLRYGTPEATSFSVEVHKQLSINAYKASCYLAKERGSFPIFDAEKEKNNPFITRLMEADSELAGLIKEGRRNIALLTISPTGTVSLMTQSTSGIEPAFHVAYKRRRKINPNDKSARIDFVDDKGDHWEEYAVFHHKFITWLEVNGYDYDEVKTYTQEKLDELVKLSPYYKATSNDVDWEEKVKMQGEIQKWIDHSISVTVNLPENTTEDVVSEIYKTAWSSGCKGMTIYREGSRSGVLISNEKHDKHEKKQTKSVDQIIKENNSPKRPQKLECEIIRFNNNKEKWIGFTGLLNGRPYEIFTGILENFQIPTFVERGWIAKAKDENGASRYDFVYIDKDGYEQEMKGLSRAFNREFWNYAKLISGVLRHGMPIPNVINLIDTLDLGGDNITSWKSGVKRMLKRFITEVVKAEGETCPSCGGTNVVRTGGCIQCLEPGCGWSKCS